MYSEHPIFQKPPDENGAIWRYLDFTKFVSLLDRRALFFAQCDTLADPFEGSNPRPNVLLRPGRYSHLPKETHPDWPAQMENMYRGAKKHIFINSWHMNQYESAAMWKIYVKSDAGVAIQSRFRSLSQCFAEYCDEHVFIGAVKYIDYELESIPEESIFWPYIHKRRSFEFERELRAIILPSRPQADRSGEVTVQGMYIPVDLDVLIERVFVSPAAPAWFRELVTSMMNRLGPAKDVVQSSLDGDPLF